MDEIIEKLRSDEHYYGKFGQQFLSNSNIKTLLKDPKKLRDEQKPNPVFLVGGYFHTAILEPEKLGNFKMVDASTRNTTKYKDFLKENGLDMCLLQSEVDNLTAMIDAMMSNDVCKDLIRPLLGEATYEEPAIVELFGNQWKGKADIINHDHKLVIDLKTTGDIDKFKWSASKYNYDSQAYIYSKLFGYEMLFIVIDKKTHQIGVFDCSEDFYRRGENKVRQASEAYDTFYGEDGYDFDQFLHTETL